MNSFVIILSLFATTLLAQTPANFTPSSTNRLNLTFGTTVITPGLQIGINVPAAAPTVFATANLTGTYVLVLVDPDAPSPQNTSNAQVLHWLQPGIQFSPRTPFNSSNITAPVVPYARPAPPVTSAAHRYIALLFLQPVNFTVPDAFSQFSATNRSRFNVTTFATAARLGVPIEANYFLVSNQTANATTNTTTSATAGATATSTPFRGDAVGRNADLWGSALVGLACVLLGLQMMG